MVHHLAVQKKVTKHDNPFLGLAQLADKASTRGAYSYATILVDEIFEMADRLEAGMLRAANPVRFPSAKLGLSQSIHKFNNDNTSHFPTTMQR